MLIFCTIPLTPISPKLGYIGVRGLPARGIFFLGAMGLGSGHLEIFVFPLLIKRLLCS